MITKGHDALWHVDSGGTPSRSPRGPSHVSRQVLRATLLCALGSWLLASCGGGGKKIVDPPKPPQLTLIESHPLSVPEPSDVTVNESGTTLWVVGNHPERVYQLDMSGNIVKTLPYEGQDLEGIAYDRRDKTLWAAEENLRQVVHLNANGLVLAKYPLGLTGELNSGLEGICLNDSGRVFVLNEKQPGLFITLNNDLTIAGQRTLSFALDYSGIGYDSQNGCFWIVSDQSETLFLWNRRDNIVEEFPLAFQKPEGVAFNPATNMIYIVSDHTNRLYVYRHTPGTSPQ